MLYPIETIFSYINTLQSSQLYNPSLSSFIPLNTALSPYPKQYSFITTHITSPKIHSIQQINHFQYSNSSILHNSQSSIHCPPIYNHHSQNLQNQYSLIQPNSLPLSTISQHTSNTYYQSQHFQQTSINSNQPH